MQVKDNTMVTRLHTIFLLVGPSMSGKTTFSKALKAALLRQGHDAGIPYRIARISSDEQRQELLQTPWLTNHSRAMLEVSQPAFEMLFAKLKAAIAYPVSSEFVIVDTTGLNEKFREDVLNLGKDQGYNVELVVFDYKKEEALRFVPESFRKEVLFQLNKLRKDVLGNLKARRFTKRTSIKSRDPEYWRFLKVSIENQEQYRKCRLFLDAEKTQKIAIIGDIHEHVEPARQLVAILDEKYPGIRKVFVGDYIDKGGNTEEAVKFMVERAQAGDIIIQANHESYVVRRLQGLIEPNPEIEEKYITSLKYFYNSSIDAALIQGLYEQSLPFLRIHSDTGQTCFVTHAPCDEVHLGKLSPFAMKAQRNLFCEDRESDYRLAYPFIFEQADKHKPLHVFGHVAHGNFSRIVHKNKVFLDTGAVYGGKLSAFVLGIDGHGVISVPCEALDKTGKQLDPSLVEPIKKDKPFNLSDYELTPNELRFVKAFPKKGAKFISGTMAPAPSLDSDIESLKAGIEYFQRRGVRYLVANPKYMGSRGQFYLFEDADKQSFATSRGGFLIRPEKVPGLQEEMVRWTDKVTKVLGPGWSEIILDGELLPWSALGQELIGEQFTDYIDLVDWEISQLNTEEFKQLCFNTQPDVEGKVEHIQQFRQTLDLYSKPVGDGPDQIPLEFKAFSVLSLKSEDWTGKDQAQMFSMFNDDEILELDLEDAECLAKAQAFFDKLTFSEVVDGEQKGLGMEGIVLKPKFPAEGVVPYMKVRNKQYLRLVYGYDYMDKIQTLSSQKNISGKASLSLQEWEIGCKMLTSQTPEELQQYVVKMLGQMKKEQALDPRL